MIFLHLFIRKKKKKTYEIQNFYVTLPSTHIVFNISYHNKIFIYPKLITKT